MLNFLTLLETVRKCLASLFPHPEGSRERPGKSVYATRPRVIDLVGSQELFRILPIMRRTA